MFEKYKKICKLLKINYKVDMALCIAIESIIVLISILLILKVNIFVGLIFLMMSIVYLYVHISTLMHKYKLIKSFKEVSIVSFLGLIILKIDDNLPLVDALEETIQYCDKYIYDEVNEFLLDLKDDISYDVYLKFANNFDNILIRNIIMLLSSNNVNLLKRKYEEIIYSKGIDNNSIENELNNLEKCKIIPVVLSLISVIIVSYYLFSSVGEIIGG